MTRNAIACLDKKIRTEEKLPTKWTNRNEQGRFVLVQIITIAEIQAESKYNSGL